MFFLLRSDNDTYSRSISTFLGAFTLSFFVAHIQYFSLLARVAIDSILPTYLHQLTQLNDEINHKCKNKKHEKKTEKNAIMNYKRHHNCDSRVVLFWISVFLDVQRNNWCKKSTKTTKIIWICATVITIASPLMQRERRCKENETETEIQKVIIIVASDSNV